MSGNLTMTAEPRGRAGKGAARETRRTGRVPAVIYGDHKDPVLVSVEPVELMQHLHGPSFFSHILELNVAGDTHRVLPRDVQFHPVTDVPLHVDFMRVGKGTRITVMVPVDFVDEEKSPGLKKGGVLNVVRHEVEVRCDPDNIPEAITVSLDGLDVGDALRISDAHLPENVKPTITDRDFILGSVGAPTAVRDENVAAAAEGEEGEAEQEGGEE